MYDNYWLKKVLVSFWAVRLLLTLVLLVIIAISLGYFEHIKDEYEEEGRLVLDTFSVGASLVLAWCSVTIIFDVTEIILFARKRFGPVAAVVLSSIKVVLWAFLFVSLVIGAAQGSHYRGGLSIFFVAVILLTTIGQLIYTSIILHRHRKGTIQHRGTYKPAAHTEPIMVAGEPYRSYDHTAPLNPFRDPSREPSPNPTNRHNGAASEYYDGSQYGPVYEMQARTTERYA